MIAKYEGNPQRAYFEPPVVSPSPTAPIVGRQRELQLAMSHYEAAKGGCARVVLVTGDPGIGKTRLLDEIARRTIRDGAVVLHGSASEAEGMPPYLPFVEALGRYIQAIPLDELRRHVVAAPQVLATLLPELVTRLGDLPASAPLPSEQARFRLFEAIGMFLANVGASHVLALTLDDLQWADTASLDLLCHIARHQPNAHLFVLGAYERARWLIVPRLPVHLPNFLASECSRQWPSVHFRP